MHSKTAVCVWYTWVWYRQQNVAFCRKLRSISDSMFNCWWRLSMSDNIYSRFLKFLTLVAHQKGLNKQCRPRSDYFWRSTFSVCYSDKYFVNSSHDNQNFIGEQKEKSFWIFRTLTVHTGLILNSKVMTRANTGFINTYKWRAVLKSPWNK